MTSPDTIAAAASGWARGERALLRLSGPGVRGLAARLLDEPPAWAPTAGVTTPRFMLTPSLGVRCVAIAYRGPRSYTGEDALELVLPGSPALLERALARLCAEPGVREAGPGEFSARAFLAGKLTLAQAEGVAATIGAGTEAQLAAAAELASGRAGARARSWADGVATLLALVEAGIDFTDQEDVVPIAPAELRRRAGDLLREIEAHLGSRAGEERGTTEPTAVLAGEPNAGKSTLFNALLGRRRSVESPVPGTTRDAIAEPLDLSRDVPGAGGVTLVDLAGLDAAAAGPIDRDAQTAARDTIARADVVLWCDPSGRFRGTLPARPGASVIRVRTKADLPQCGTGFQPVGLDRGTGVPPVNRPKADAPTSAALPVCALDRWNLPTLRRAIADAAWGSVSTSPLWVLPRHRRTLASAAEHLRSALASVPPDGTHALTTPELTAAALRSALDALGELAGDISPDDVIGRVFATFCVGK